MLFFSDIEAFFSPYLNLFFPAYYFLKKGRKIIYIFLTLTHTHT